MAGSTMSSRNYRWTSIGSIFLVACSLLLIHETVRAQDTTDKPEEFSLDELVNVATVDMPITTTPASFLLGTAGENVPRLSSFREFSTQLAQAFDESGEVVNSVSAEIAPALAMDNLTWENIVDSHLWRTWARTTVSAATDVGSDSNGDRSSVGVQSILYAPAMDGALLKAGAEECRGTKDSFSLLDKLGVPPVLPDQPTDQDIKKYKEELEKWEKDNDGLRESARSSIEKCQNDIDGILTKWNQSMVAFGVGKVFNQEEKDSSSYWLTASFGSDISRKDTSADTAGYLVTAHLREISNVAIGSEDTNDVLADQTLVGLNLKFGYPKFAFIAEYSSLSSDASGVSLKDRKRSLLGMEYKLGSDLYLTLGMARDSGNDESQQSVVSGLKWGFGKAPVLKYGS